MIPLLVDQVERIRIEATAAIDDERRVEFGQFLTPAPVARLMGGMLNVERDHVRILEPGAGAGSLIAAAVEALLARPTPPRHISVTAYEIDPVLVERLNQTLDLCRDACISRDVTLDWALIEADFIELAAAAVDRNLFGGAAPVLYDVVITNPPYRKINNDSRHRQLLRSAGVETSNLYSGFMALAVQLLAPGGEIVAITPRSFCNGAYFRPFRELLLRTVAFQRIHVFNSRKVAFKGDDVLQENVIWRAVQGATAGTVEITAGDGSDEVSTWRQIDHDQLVWPGDPSRFIHIVPDAEAQAITDAMRNLPCALHDLDVEVSTGRVVDFRVKEYLLKDPAPGAAPLIYSAHFDGGYVRWPVESKKPNALALDDFTRTQLVPNEVYVLLKRFSSKEERRRIVAVVYDPARIDSEVARQEGVGFENHTNYVHRRGRGLSLDFARGLAIYFNSTLVDQFFRQFSGHTQVNAGDLRMLHYPTPEQLTELGRQVGDTLPDQVATDALVEQVLSAVGV